MEESKLQREFNQRDVQRMRNIITKDYNAKTTTQIGYSKVQAERKEGDVWEEGGKPWTIKNGIKQSITKLDKFKHLIGLPLTCPCCKKSMKSDELNKKMYSIHKMCLDCVVEMEAKLKIEGKFDEYQKNIVNSNKNASLEDFEKALESWLEEKDTYVSEQGDIENWSGGDKTTIYKELKERIDEWKKVDIY